MISKKLLEDLLKEVGKKSEKMEALKKAVEVNWDFNQLDKKTQGTVKSFINHLHMAQIKPSKK